VQQRHGFNSVLRLVSLLLAMAEAATAQSVAQDFANGLVDAVTVEIVNHRTQPIYVAFSARSSLPAQAVWTPSCLRFNNETRIAPGGACRAFVPTSVGPSRVCASEYPTAQGKSPNCYDAQRTNQTIVETNFVPALGCERGDKGCVWYNVNVTPVDCTDCEWKTNNCNTAGGPAYNLPVNLSCPGEASFTCQGPVASIGPHNTRYPAACGAPWLNPNCVGGLNPTCLQAYFYPMSALGACKYPPSLPQPIAKCPMGKTLTINFLDGP
jgi:hypothetical protein